MTYQTPVNAGALLGPLPGEWLYIRGIDLRALFKKLKYVKIGSINFGQFLVHNEDL